MEVWFDTASAERGFEVVADAGITFFSDTSVNICLVGNNKLLKTHIENAGFGNRPGVRIVNSNEWVTMNELPQNALMQKENASIHVAMRETACYKHRAVISPGHTGATVLAAKTHWGMMPGIQRLCLCQMIPSFGGGHFLLSDAGASVQSNPVDLLHYAIMTSATATQLLGIKKPRVALLNIGSESSKGDQRLIDTHNLMKQHLPEFVGNIEGSSIWDGMADVVITDGITGNILIKSSEKLVSFFIKTLLNQNSNETVKNVTRHFRTHDYGGAILLGTKGTGIVCHGQASVTELRNAAKLAIKCMKSNLAEVIENTLIQSGINNF